MKTVKVIAILLLATFSYSAVSAQTIHHRHYRRHHMVRHHLHKR